MGGAKRIVALGPIAMDTKIIVDMALASGNSA